MLPAKNVKHLFMEVAMPMIIISSLYMNVNKNAQVSKIKQTLYAFVCNDCNQYIS